jgi:hypothetical protein
MNDKSSDRTFLVAKGFQGFQTLSELMKTELITVPTFTGVYAILRNTQAPASFLEKSNAGHFNGKDPTVSIDICRDRWVTNSDILYYGKANDLKKRIGQYLSYGSGKPVGHWGGRLIWQVEGVWDFLGCWCFATNPSDKERELIVEFKNNHAGALPFANWVV